MEWNIRIGKNRGVATNWCKWNIMWRNMCFLFWIYILYTNCIINIQPQAKLHEMALGIICSIAATYRAPPQQLLVKIYTICNGKKNTEVSILHENPFYHWFLLILLAFIQEKLAWAVA